MKKVMTVLGPVTPDELGFTSMHEHVLADMTIWGRKYAPLAPDDHSLSWDDPVSLENIGLLRRNWFLVEENALLADEELMTAEVADFRAAGGTTIVEMSCLGLRLDLLAIQRISQRTGVHIVAATGLYVEDACPEYTRDMTIEQLSELMVREIESGIGDTGIKAGHIGELGILDLGDRDVRLLKAAGRASIQTGLSVSVHLSGSQSGGADGHRVVDILTQEGMAEERIIINHTDGFLVERDATILIAHPDKWGLRLDYHRGLLDRGVNIAFDNFGHWWEEELLGRITSTDWQRIAGLLALADAGYSSQIVLGTDTCMKMLLRRCGGEGYARLTNYVVPTLKAYGVSDQAIQLMTVSNPARLLAH